jgi:hypothetical protein
MKRIPNSACDFRDMAMKANYRMSQHMTKMTEFDESLVSIDNLLVLQDRLTKVPTDEKLAGVVDIVQKYEPNLIPPDPEDELSVDLAKFHRITVEKLNSYLRDVVPYADGEMPGEDDDSETSSSEDSTPAPKNRRSRGSR